MKATLIRISNIMGISDLTIKPGTITEISGQNGQGKTSAIEAIRSIGVKGHDATLLRKGETQGRVVIELEDGSEIVKTITADKTDRKLKGPNGERGGATAIEALIDVLSINPVEFLTADPKRQLEILIASIDITLTDEELSEAVGFKARVAGTPLECMSAMHKAIYDERTGVSRAVKEKKATLSQLSEAIPPNIAGDPDAELVGVEDALRIIATSFDSRRTEIERWKSRELQRINDKANADLQELLNQLNVDSQPLIDRKAALQEQTKTKAAFAQQGRVIDQMGEQLEELVKEEESKTKALEGLKALKASKMENLPFQGLHIQDGRILVNGIPFERLNTAEQVKFAINLAVRRAGDLKIICVDGLERIDGIRYEKFKEAVSTMTDYQFIVARVSDQPLEVRTS